MSSYQDPLLMSAVAAQQEYENKKGPSTLDIIGGLALGAGIGALAGRGIVRGMRRGRVQPVTVQDLGSTGAAAEQNVRRAAAPPPSRPAPGPTSARQAQTEEFVRQARTERPSGIQLVNVQDLGNTKPAGSVSALPQKLLNAAEEEYVSPYRKGPTYRDLYPSRFKFPPISPETIQARRQTAAQSAAAAREKIPKTYQLELGGEVSPTLRQLRSSEFGPNFTQTRREALGLAEETATSPEFSFIKSSIPLTEAPKQFNIFNYLEDQGYKESSSTDIPYQGTRSAITATTPAVEAGGDAADRLILEYQQLAQRQARADQRAQASVREYQMRVRGAGERVLNELQQESLVDRQNTIKLFNVDQAINAVESGEDQMTGRIKQQLQRNEDLDLTQVELLEEIADANYLAGMEQDEPINQAATQLPDGIPIDQAENTPSAFAQKQMMQVRMTQLRDQLAQEGYRGLRLEKELAARTNIKQASELYASTGDPAVLQLASATPSLPLTVKPKTNLQLGQSKTSYTGEDVPTGTYYEPFKQRESESGGLVQADIYYTNKLSNLAAKLEGAPQYIDNPDYVNFIEQTNMAMSAMRQGDEIARKIFARNKNLIDTGRAPAPKIENPEYSMLQRRMSYAEQSRSEVRDKQNALELQAQRFPMVQKVVSTGEGGRLFAEVDPVTGELIPETVEVRAGRPALPGGVISQTSTGRAIRGRVGAEGTVAGAMPGIFEPAAVLAESTFKPESARYRGETSRGAYEAADAGKGLEYEAQPVLWNRNIHSPEQRTPEGFVYSEEAMLPPTQAGLRGKSFSTRPSVSSAAALESVDVSEQLRRLQRSGRPEEAQAFLDKIMQERKISALGSSMPIRQQFNG